MWLLLASMFFSVDLFFQIHVLLSMILKSSYKARKDSSQKIEVKKFFQLIVKLRHPILFNYSAFIWQKNYQVDGLLISFNKRELRWYDRRVVLAQVQNEMESEKGVDSKQHQWWLPIYILNYLVTSHDLYYSSCKFSRYCKVI